MRGDLRDRRQFDCRRCARARRSARAGARSRPSFAKRRRTCAGAREAWPDVGLGARYERDEDETSVRRSRSSCRSSNADKDARGSQRAGQTPAPRPGRRDARERRRGSTAFEVHARREAALAELEVNALPQLDEIESLARRSYAAGQIGLSEYQVVESDGLDLRRDYADLLLRGGGGADPARDERWGAAMRSCRCRVDRRTRDRGRQRLSRRAHVEAREEPAAAESQPGRARRRRGADRSGEPARPARHDRAGRGAAGGEGVTALGELGVNEDAYAEVGPAIAGARRAACSSSPGERVEAGDAARELESAELGRARAARVSARARARRSRASARRASASWSTTGSPRGASCTRPRPSWRPPRPSCARPRAALSALGVAPSESARKGGDARFMLRSPLAGQRARTQRRAGRRSASPGRRCSGSADLARLWLIVHAFERDALRVQRRIARARRVRRAARPDRCRARCARRQPGRAELAHDPDPHRGREPRRRAAPRHVGDAPGFRSAMPAPRWSPCRRRRCSARGRAGASSCRAAKAAFERAQGRPRPRPRRRGRDRSPASQPGESVVVDGAFLLKAEADKARGEGEQHDH